MLDSIIGLSRNLWKLAFKITNCREKTIPLFIAWTILFELMLLAGSDIPISGRVIVSKLGINFYLLRTFCPHLGSFLCCFFFYYVSAKFHLWPSSGDLPRPRIGMMSLVTVSPVVTAFHSCCLSHHFFWPSKPLAGLGRIWNRYLLTMLNYGRQ